MRLHRVVGATVCVVVLGAQLWAMFPVRADASTWYWPFLPYPMYAVPHLHADSLIVRELRLAPCGSARFSTVARSELLDIPRNQVMRLLKVAAYGGDPSERESAMMRLDSAVDAEYPGRYCAASAWERTVVVGDTSTHHLDMPMRRTAAWAMQGPGAR